MPKCKFRSSFGGFNRCNHEEYLNGLCEFHYGCFTDYDLDEHGVISDKVVDQARRREINFYGIERSDRVYVSD
jgi:hypothetical protein